MKNHTKTYANSIETLRQPEDLLVHRDRVVLPTAVENLRRHAPVESENVATIAELVVPPQQEAAETFNSQVTTNLQPDPNGLSVSSETIASTTELRADVARQAVKAAQGYINPIVEGYYQDAEKAA